MASSSNSAERLLFVVDESAYAACGADVVLQPILRSHIVARFSGFELNPKIADIERGAEQSRAFSPDLVIALGGGTAIESKSIAALSRQLDSPRDIVTGQSSIIGNGPPLIVIPTTAGTGSEATQFAVAYVDEKYSVSPCFDVAKLRRRGTSADAQFACRRHSSYRSGRLLPSH